MAEEITYIPYGQDEISQQDLMTSLANGVPGYLDNKRWAKKDKYRQAWLNAYQNIINGGLVGASNSSGIWTIQHGGEPIDLNTLSNVDKEMYQDAAYYIQQQMSKMTPRKKEEEAKKENLEKYGDFKTNLMNQILKGYGNNSELFADSEQGWDAQDARGDNGLRGTQKRKEAMIKELGAYRDSLNDKDFNFEGTSFKDKADLQTKIQAAIDALKNTPDDESDDLPAFNALGLPYRAFFSNGGNEASTHINEATGNPYTWNQWNEYQQQQAATKAKQEAEKLKQQRANQWKSFRTLNASHIAGRPLTAEESNATYLDNLFAKGKWTGDESSQIVTAFKLAEKNGKLVGLSKEELAKLPSTWKNRGKYLRRIEGLSTPFYYDTLSGQFKLFNNNDLSTKISFQDVLDQNNPEKLEQKRLELQSSKKLKDEDWDIIGADTVSMLGDIVSLGGGYAGAAGGVTTILSDLYADLRRGKDFWDVTKNLAKNTAWGIAGLIPGVKLAKLGKRAAQLYALYNSWGIISDPDVHKSWQKLINGEDFTSHDFENLKWTLHAVTGAHNTARSHFTDAKLNKQLKNNKVTVETKNGKRTITTEQQKEINKAGGRGGQEAANKKFKEITKEEAAEGSFNFNTENRKWYNPSRYSQTLRNVISDESKLEGTPVEASKSTINNLLEQDKNKPIIANPFSSKTYKGWFTNGGPNRGYITMALGKTPQGTKSDNTTTEVATSETPKTTSKKTWAEIEKEPKKWSQSTEAKEYKEMLKGNYSSNAIQGGTHKIGDLTINVDIPRPGATNGFAEVTFSNGTKQTIRFDNQKQLQDQVAKIVKERRVQTDSSGKKIKVDAKEMGKILKSLKARGFLKQGGTINTSLDNIIEDFFKNNNI